MALQRDYEIPNTGFVVPNAYHVIMHIHAEKVLGVEATEKTVGEDPKYVGKISVNVWASKEDKDAGKVSLGGLPLLGEDLPMIFDLNNEDSSSIFSQAYTHLKSTNYYKDAQEV